MLTILAIIIFIIFLIIFTISNSKNERKHIQAILSNESEWGYEICQLFIENKHSFENAVNIMSHFDEWGEKTIRKIITRDIVIGMNEDMVKLSWGKPTNVDNIEITEKNSKKRWIFGIPRHGAKYVWFKNGLVTKIKK